MNDIRLLLDRLSTLNGSVEQLRAYVRETGIDLNAQRFAGYTPLMHCSFDGKTKIARMLIEYGVDLDVTATNLPYTALTYAVALGHAEVIETLINAGANLKYICAIPYSDQFTNILWRSKRNVPQNLLNRLILQAVVTRPIKTLKMLVRMGADVNTYNGQRHKTPLYIISSASQSGYNQSKKIKYLLKAGANPNVSNDWYTTPLALVNTWKDMKATLTLLQHGATHQGVRLHLDSACTAWFQKPRTLKFLVIRKTKHKDAFAHLPSALFDYPQKK